MIERRKPIPVGEAVNKIMNYAIEGTVQYIPIEESYQRYLAQDVKATHDVPPFNKSPYDGFALRSVDTKAASLDNPIEFEVIDEIGAGMVSDKNVQAFQAVRIMTGAKIPDDCDAVVMLELTKDIEKNGKKFMAIKRSMKKGENVSFQGEDAKDGEVILRKGTFINPGVQAILATFGYAKVPVAKKPVVGLFATGTELLNVDQPLQPGKIRNSNSHMISAQIIRAGAEVKYLGILPDIFDTCFEAVKEALKDIDILITTGGVSVGDYDYLPAIYEKLGAEVLFNKVAMRPGSVTTVAQADGKLLFGLSGNPSACYVGFELFTRPIIRKMLYSTQPHLRKEKAILQADFPKPNPFTRFVRTYYSFENGRLQVIPSGLDKSNVVTSLANANGLTVLPGGTRGFQKGMEVDVLLLDDQEGSEWPW